MGERSFKQQSGREVWCCGADSLRRISLSFFFLSFTLNLPCSFNHPHFFKSNLGISILGQLRYKASVCLNRDELNSETGAG